ncbi:Conserved hypothetical protein [Shewanella piezotolerans WP3]|uniref:DUF4265 domain-containing protein n=1 Tax=Shewanella piezotolerans (strain WP3 / JCM 13877) TaxID=225849 RepID=B8CRR8_SHEPW|nr:DUF4265 domain-containing protein [Shewanella piezotolerans]ACJ30076.1 Conserved hypothetical protein [Shewanella piezotolerans WP3]
MSELVKIRIELPPENILNASSETLWAKPLGKGLFKLQNSPFGAYGYSFEDVVIADDNEVPTVLGVHENSGHSTYRILLKDGILNTDEFSQAWGELESIGCTYEGSQSKLLAIDVPADTDIFHAYKLLEAGEEAELWEFEEAKCAHNIEA